MLNNFTIFQFYNIVYTNIIVEHHKIYSFKFSITLGEMFTFMHLSFASYVYMYVSANKLLYTYLLIRVGQYYIQ